MVGEVTCIMGGIDTTEIAQIAVPCFEADESERRSEAARGSQQWSKV